MSKPTFVYVTYIATTPEKVFHALTDTDVTSKYWRGLAPNKPQWQNESDFKPGSRWRQRQSDDEKNVGVVGKVLESTPPRRLVLTWALPKDEHDVAMYSRVTFDIEEQADGIVKLTVLHEELSAELQQGVSIGWPMVLSSLKTYLETGRALPVPR